MRSGWTLKYRKRWEKGYHKDHLLWVMMDWFIDHAAWEDTEIFSNGCKAKLKRGQVVFGQSDLAAFLGVTRDKIRHRVEVMKNMDFITTKGTNKGTVATVVNYDKYQTPMTTTDEDIPNETPTESPGSPQQPPTNKESKRSKRKKEKIYSENSDEFRLANLLFYLIRVRYDEYLKPNLNTWAKSIDYMIRIDKRTIGQIEKVIRWCQGNEFWQDNILSTSKLRKQFDQLSMKMKSGSGNKDEKLPDGYFDPYDTPFFKNQQKKNEEAFSKMEIPEEKEEVFEDDPEFNKLTHEEKMARCKELKAKVIRKLSA